MTSALYSGPASSLYGNASGGVINLTTEDGRTRPFAETRITGGSFTELFYAHPSGLYGAFNFLYVDRFYADDTNLNHNSSYAVLNLRLGDELQLGHSKISPFVVFNNIGNEHYNGLIRLNAVGRRFYKPSPDFNVYGGVAIGY